MPTLRLDAKLGLNKTGFDAGMRDAQRVTERFAKTMTSRVGSGLLAAFSVQKLVQFGSKVLEQGVTIDKLSRKFNLTTDEVQLLQHEANRTGQSFNELVSDAEQLEQILSRLRGGEGVIFSRQQVQELADAHEKIQAFNDEKDKLLAKTIEEPSSFFKRILGFGPFGLGALGRGKGAQLLFGGDPDAKTPEAVPGAAGFLEKEAADKRARKRVAEIVKETATLREQIQKRLLSDEEKLVKLEKEREEIFKRMARTAVERAQKEQDLTKNELAIAQAKESIDRKGGKDDVAGGFTPLQNPLGTIGAFSGSSQSNTGANLLQSVRRIESALIQKGILVKDVR